MVLADCGVDSAVVLPVLATLTELQHLEFGRNCPLMSDDTLRLLMPLTNLTHLSFGRPSGYMDMQSHDVSDEAWQSFVAAMPKLLGITIAQ